MSKVNSGVTGPNFMKFSHNREASFMLLTSTLRLWYPILFRNGRAISAGGVGNFAAFLPLNWLPWQRPLRYWKHNFRSIIYTQNAFIWCKIYKKCAWFVFFLVHKIGCCGNVSWGIGKNGLVWQRSHKYIPFGEKIVKIGPADPEIALLN